MRGKLFSFSFLRITIRITPADAGKTHAVAAGSACAGDHPRGCGENAANTKAREVAKGSPPRMRGKLDSVQIRKFAHGITPADAGKTSIFTVRQADTEDHPRGCGENVQTSLFRPARRGSPPRMRGKLPQSRL